MGPPDLLNFQGNYMVIENRMLPRDKILNIKNKIFVPDIYRFIFSTVENFDQALAYCSQIAMRRVSNIIWPPFVLGVVTPYLDMFHPWVEENIRPNTQYIPITRIQDIEGRYLDGYTILGNVGTWGKRIWDLEKLQIFVNPDG
jgi:hypothetical protein